MRGDRRFNGAQGVHRPDRRGAAPTGARAEQHGDHADVREKRGDARYDLGATK